MQVQHVPNVLQDDPGYSSTADQVEKVDDEARAAPAYADGPACLAQILAREPGDKHFDPLRETFEFLDVLLELGFRKSMAEHPAGRIVEFAQEAHLVSPPAEPLLYPAYAREQTSDSHAKPPSNGACDTIANHRLLWFSKKIQMCSEF